MVLLRARSHAALVAVACVAAVLFTSVVHAAPFNSKNLTADFKASSSSSINNNGGLDFDFSSSSNLGGIKSSSSSSGSFSGISPLGSGVGGSSTSNNGFGGLSSSSSFGGSSTSNNRFGGLSSSGSSSFGGLSTSNSGFGGSSNQGTQPNFFEQIARTSQVVGSMINSFFTSLGRQANQNRVSGGSNMSPLVAIDTHSGAPVIDIPGIFGLNTGHTSNGGSSSLVSVNTRDGTRVRAPFVDVDTRNGNTRVQAPFTNVNTNKGETRVQAPFTDIITNSGGTRVQAPFTDVNTNSGGTRVQAPFTDVNTNSGGTRVQAPFTDVNTNSGGTSVQAPFTNVNTNSIRTRVQAPFVSVDAQKTNEIMPLPSAQRSLFTHTGSVFPARSKGISIFQLTPLSLNAHLRLTSNHLFPSAPKPTRHHPFISTSAPATRVPQYSAAPRNMQKSSNLANSVPFTSTSSTSTPRPGSRMMEKFPNGLEGYQRIRFDPNLRPNFFRDLNISPNDIPDSLVQKGYDTPHKVRMYVIDKATEMVEKAKIVS